MPNVKWQGAKAKPSVVARELATGEQARSPRKKLTIAEVKERVLWLLQFQGYRDLVGSPIEFAFWCAVTAAISDGDHHFFRALSERLKEKPIPFKPPREFLPLVDLLLEHWIAKKGICLCWFSNKALSDFLKQTQKSYYAPDAIRKAYDRLGLRKLRRPLERGIEPDRTDLRLLG
jgi:hypothetical protein